MKFYESGVPGSRTVMLLPDNFMTHRQFEHIAPKLAEEFRVICVDFDGYGENVEHPELVINEPKAFVGWEAAK